jgi:hypothetical protein
MFEFSSTYSANPSAAFSSGSMSVSSASSSFSASSSLGSSFRSSVGTTAAPISVRTSDKTLRSFSSGGGVGSYTSSGSGSFISIHNEVSSGLSSPTTSLPLAYAEGDGSSTGPGGRPGSGATGELNPEFASPVGDVLLPMLLMVGVYAVIKWFKNHKFVKSIKS